jgi:AmmeMemoRadiSam system protein B
MDFHRIQLINPELTYKRMNITELSKERISEELKKAKSKLDPDQETIRILFSPQSITDQNIEEVSSLYGRLGKNDFDTVIVIESRPSDSLKKIPMPSHKSFSTPYGEVLVNDKLRNEFCDEDDDFFIDDNAWNENLSLYHQLIMLQSSIDDFSVVSIQLTDESSFIVRELAGVLEEILATRNALIIFCCDLDSKRMDELNKIIHLIESGNQSGMMNYLNSDDSHIDGKGAFIAGLMVAGAWGLKLNFIALQETSTATSNLLSGYADMQRHQIYG